MSTRCQIGIYEENEKISPNAITIYRHSDGYPDRKHGVIASIMPLLKDFKKEHGNDTEYSTAQLLYKLIDQTKRCAVAKGYWNNSSKYLGYGVTNSIHTDIEYYYAVYPNVVKVFKLSEPENLSTWTLIKEITY
jgi:hypothetical protein